MLCSIPRFPIPPPPGTPALRAAIAALEGVDPDAVQVVTGASEALLILFFLAAEPGANVVIPNPGFPANAALAESLGIAVRYYHLRRGKSVPHRSR